jgi:hypothetical protein
VSRAKTARRLARDGGVGSATAFEVDAVQHAAILRKIARMLRPAGYTYVSEPLFVGEFNELVGIFHDEQGLPRAGLCSDRAGG